MTRYVIRAYRAGVIPRMDIRAYSLLIKCAMETDADVLAGGGGSAA